MKVVLRVLVGGGVIAFLLLRSDTSKLWGSIRAADPLWFAGALASVVAGLLVSALRWRAYLDALDLPLRYGSLFRLYFVGIFFNAFLPTGMGGDAYKAMRLGHGSKRADMKRPSFAPAVASVFLDRFAGAVGVAVVGLVASLALFASGDHGRLPATALVLASGLLAAAGVMLLRGERLLGKGRLVPDRGWGAKVRRSVRAIHEGARHPQAAGRGYVLSLVVWGILLMGHVTIARALGMQVSVGGLACVMVVASLVTLLPVTINGLGFREGAYVWGLGLLGVEHDSALAFGLLILIVVLLASATGGMVYLARGGDVRVPHDQGDPGVPSLRSGSSP